MGNKCDLEKTLNTVISVGFVMLLMGMLALCIITPDKEKSEMENREFQSMPKLNYEQVLDGSYMKNFEAYASDNVVGRTKWVVVKNNLDVYSGKKDNGSVYFGEDGYLFPIEKINQVQFEKNLAYTKTFAEKIKETNSQIEVSVLLAPTSPEILKDKLPKYVTAPGQQQLFLKADDDLGPMFINTVDTLGKQGGEYLYYKTDHHWTSLGAYYAYVAWAEHVGIKPLSLDSFDIETISQEFYGTTYSKAVGVKTEPDSMERFSNETIEESTMSIKNSKGQEKEAAIFDDSYLTTKDKYSYFLSGNNPLSVIETPVKNHKNLLIIKDSYANSFVPFMAAHFEKIYVVDLRYYKENVQQLIEKNQISDVLMLYNVVQYSNDRNLIYLALKK